MLHPSTVRVLLIDDEPADRAWLARLLADSSVEPIQIWEAEDGHAALELIERTPIDVALIDYLLPDIDGLEVLHRLLAENPAIAAILLTGQGSETVAARAIQAGAQDYLIKRDVGGADLARRVARALSHVRLAREHARAAAELRRAHAEMDHFVRALSHDLGAQFMLLEYALNRLQAPSAASDTSTENLAYATACFGEAKRFLADLVTLGRTGAIDMEPQRVDVAEVAAEVLFEQRPLLEARRIRATIAAGLPTLWANRTRVKQIITNLVRNAARHGCSEIAPQIEIAPADGANAPAAAVASESLAWFEVRDNGPGVPPAHRETIFLPGRRLHSRDEGGHGLGLAIVAKIASHYGGQALVTADAAFAIGLPAASRATPIPHLRRTAGIANPAESRP